MLKDSLDKELWVRIKNNDPEALTLLFRRYYFFLVKAGLNYVPDAELAKDAANDVFFNLWRNRSSLSDVENIKAYLSTSLRNQIFHYQRRDGKTQEHLKQWQEVQAHSQLSYEEILVALQVKEDQKEKLRRALEQLTPRQKEYLQLKYYEGLSYEQIAEKTGQALKTIYNTTYKAIQVLRDAIHL